MKQLELVPAVRPRVRLEDPPEPRARLVDQATAASKILSDPAIRPPVSDRDLIPDPNLDRSGWSAGDEKPPAVGFWEVTDHKSGTLLARWWFGGVWWVKGDPRDKVNSQLSHDEFVKQYAWRGLRKPHPDVYPCPPYASYALVERARLQGHGILTTYVRQVAGGGVTEVMNPPQYPTGRPRVKL